MQQLFLSLFPLTPPESPVRLLCYPLVDGQDAGAEEHPHEAADLAGKVVQGVQFGLPGNRLQVV